jgi:hypothetical protein
MAGEGFRKPAGLHKQNRTHENYDIRHKPKQNSYGQPRLRLFESDATRMRFRCLGTPGLGTRKNDRVSNP